MKQRSSYGVALVAFMLFMGVPVLFSIWILGAQAEQAFDLRLVGTAVTEEPGKSFAIIEVQSTGGQGAFHEGDRWGEIIIKKILPGSVIIDTGRGEELLSMSYRGNRGGLSSPQQTAHLDRKEVDSTVPDPMQLMQKIRVRAHFEGGKPGGFLIYGIEPESIFARMGLNDGDIIVSVNGRSFTTTAPTMEFYNALKRGGTVSLEIKRGESKQELHFEIQ